MQNAPVKLAVENASTSDKSLPLQHLENGSHFPISQEEQPNEYPEDSLSEDSVVTSASESSILVKQPSQINLTCRPTVENVLAQIEQSDAKSITEDSYSKNDSNEMEEKPDNQNDIGRASLEVVDNEENELELEGVSGKSIPKEVTAQRTKRFSTKFIRNVFKVKKDKKKLKVIFC